MTQPYIIYRESDGEIVNFIVGSVPAIDGFAAIQRDPSLDCNLGDTLEIVDGEIIITKAEPLPAPDPEVVA